MPGNTKLLCHFDGSNGATSVADEVGGVSWDLFDSFLTTGDYKFPSACLSNSFGATANATGVSCSASGNWTVEGWGKSAGNPNGTRISWANSGSVIRGHIELRPNTGEVTWEVNDSSGSLLYANAVGVTISSNTWYHYAIVREGTAYSFYFNGSRVDTFTSSSNTSDIAEIWLSSGTTGDRFDEVRVSNSARYSGSTYTVPSAEFTYIALGSGAITEAADTPSASGTVWAGMSGVSALSIAASGQIAGASLSGGASVAFSGLMEEPLQGFAGQAVISLTAVGDMTRPDPLQFGARARYVDVLAEAELVHAVARPSVIDIRAEPSE